MPTKKDLHKIVDQLDDSDIDAALEALTFLRDEPDDYDSLSPEVIADIEQSQKDIEAGRFATLEEMKKELGI